MIYLLLSAPEIGFTCGGLPADGGMSRPPEGARRAAGLVTGRVARTWTGSLGPEGRRGPSG